MASQMPPSQVVHMYSPNLQGVLDGRCRSVLMLSERDDVPTLKDLAVGYEDFRVAADWIKVQLEVVNSFCNTKAKLSTEQMYAISEQILALYDDLNLLEFILFCGRLRRGVYEKFYGAVDAQKILVSLDTFYAERNKLLMDKREEDRKKALEEELRKPGVNPRKLIAEHPGKYKTLERLYASDKGLQGSVKKVPDSRKEQKKLKKEDGTCNHRWECDEKAWNRSHKAVFKCCLCGEIRII